MPQGHLYKNENNKNSFTFHLHHLHSDNPLTSDLNSIILCYANRFQNRKIKRKRDLSR